MATSLLLPLSGNHARVASHETDVDSRLSVVSDAKPLIFESEVVTLLDPFPPEAPLIIAHCVFSVSTFSDI